MSIMYPYPGVFNVQDPWWDSGSGYIGMVPGSTTAPDPANNYQVLLAIINLAQASNDQSAGKYYGATIIFPGHKGVPAQGGTGVDAGGTYFIQGPGDGSPTVPIASNWPIKFVGTGSAKLMNYIDPDNPDFVIGDFFAVRTDGRYDSNPDHTLGDNFGGMTFENLTLEFDSNTTQTGVAAIHTVTDITYSENGGVQNVRINACVFTNCPVGVWFEEALQCSMFQCTSNFDGNAAEAGATAVKIGGPSREGITDIFAKDIFITDCIFYASNSVGGNVGLDLISAEHVRLKSVRFDGFDMGIQIRPGYGGSGVNVLRSFFTDVTVFVPLNYGSITGQAGTALTIQPQSTDQQIGQLTFEGCTFEPGDNMDITSTVGPGIVIDANGSIISTVRFVSCYAARWSGPGLSVGIADGIGTLQDIEVLGGMYAGNNLGGGGTLPYGIAIFGPATGVRIVGVSCVGQYKYIRQNNEGTSPQQVGGIYIAGAVEDVIIDGCDLRNGTTYGVYILGASGAVPTNIFIRNSDISDISPYSDAVYVDNPTYVSNVQVTNCAGYNDRHVTLTSSPPVSGVTFYPYSFGYWGPIEFYTIQEAGSTISAIDIDGTNVNLKSGSFLLVTGEYAAITWSGGIVPIAFVVIGK